MATIARNIGAAGRRQRLLYGSISLVVGIAAAALLIELDGLAAGM